MHAYEVRPRKDKRGFDLISDVLPFGGCGMASRMHSEMQSDGRCTSANHMMRRSAF
jgi:hypothetical protein